MNKNACHIDDVLEARKGYLILRNIVMTRIVGDPDPWRTYVVAERESICEYSKRRTWNL